MKIEDINFEKRGWMKLIFNERLKSNLSIDTNKEISVLKSGYKTGLFYGHPLSSFFDDEVEELKLIERIKAIYFDHFYNTFLINNNDLLGKNDEDIIKEFSLKLLEFQEIAFPKILKPALFQTSIDKKAERFIDKRAIVKKEWYEGFWHGLFYNSLLFIDIILWNRFLMNPKGEEIVIFQKSFSSDFGNLLSILINSNEENETEQLKQIQIIEEVYFNKISVKGASQNQLNSIFSFPLLDLERNFIYQFASLIFWAKGKTELDDITILKDIGLKLNFNENEMIGAQISVVSFIMEYWKRLRHIQSVSTYMIFANYQLKILKEAAEKNKTELEKEISESEYINEVLKNITFEGLKWVDKDKIKREIANILFGKLSSTEISENSKMFTIAHLVEIIPNDILPKGLFSGMATKRSKRTTLE